MDRSVFSLLNLSSSINRLYRENNRYFWFKNPLILLQQRSYDSLSQLVRQYIECLIEMLPW